MAWHRCSDDDLFEVDHSRMTQVDLFTSTGEFVARVEIPEQLIPEGLTAILFDGRCFLRREDGRYCEVYSVVGVLR